MGREISNFMDFVFERVPVRLDFEDIQALREAVKVMKAKEMDTGRIEAIINQYKEVQDADFHTI